MARVLIVTGRLAEPIIKRVLAESKSEHKVDVIVTPIPIAAFLTAEYIAEYLKRFDVKGYDYILIPGLARGSGRVVEEATGVKTVKGSVNAYDLVELLKLPDLSVLSPDEPADEVLSELIERQSREILKCIEEALTDDNSVVVGGLRIPIRPPPIRVATEISEAHTLDLEKLVKEAVRYVENGADMIVLGFEALQPHEQRVSEAVKALKREVDVPVAVDTSIPSEIDVAIRAGADMVINVDLTNIGKVTNVDREVAVVTTPRDPVTGAVPRDPSARVELLEKAVATIKAKGFEKVFADAILESFGQTFSSLLAYYMFKQRNPRVPLLAGIGNVTELIDADSIGVNASMVMLAQELGIGLVLVVEKSAKARGSTLEAKVTSQMATLAHYKSSPPKNLGLSLLVVKDKKVHVEELDEGYDTVVEAVAEDKPYVLDPVGVFKIRVNHELGCIEALYIGRKGRVLIRGRSARAVQQKIIENGFVTQLSHAMYLGRELAKAEIALQLGKNYVQEKPLFSKPKYIKI